MKDTHGWKNEILSNTNIKLINPTSSEMIDSTLLPDHHKDPFDRLLIAQAYRNKLLLVTKDKKIQKYTVSTFWIQETGLLPIPESEETIFECFK